jgi:hypothetical protein
VNSPVAEDDKVGLLTVSLRVQPVNAVGTSKRPADDELKKWKDIDVATMALSTQDIEKIGWLVRKVLCRQ